MNMTSKQYVWILPAWYNPKWWNTISTNNSAMPMPCSDDIIYNTARGYFSTNAILLPNTDEKIITGQVKTK